MSNAETMTMDFEKANWKAINKVKPGIKRKGCAFHWSQAIWRRIQKLKLAKRYGMKSRFYHAVRKVFALCFLPPEHIKDALNHLSLGQDAKDEPLKR